MAVGIHGPNLHLICILAGHNLMGSTLVVEPSVAGGRRK